MSIPPVKFATHDGINIAYQRWGRGEQVVLYTPPWVSNIELEWELEEFARIYQRGGQHTQVIKLDKRGMGLSDRTNEAPSLDERVHDTLAVMDAEGIDSVTLVGHSEGAAIAIGLAAQQPDRVEKLVLLGPSLPGVPTTEILKHVHEGDPELAGLQRIKELLHAWGTDESPQARYFMPDAAGDARVETWIRKWERQSASPGALRAHLASAMSADVTKDLDQISHPTFIGHSIGDLIVPVASSRWLATQIPHATLTLWDDPNHAFTFSPKWRQMQDDVIEFITGSRPATETTTTFAVVLFTDIVDSTQRTHQMGDEAWARLIRAHDTTADRVLTDYNGRRVKSTGDGLLAVFDDPARAVNCAQALRGELDLLGLSTRSGIHAGQIEQQPDGDITGIAVNLTSRIESAALPGDICVSRTLCDLLLGTNTDFETLGHQTLKGIQQPVEIMRLL